MTSFLMIGSSNTTAALLYVTANEFKVLSQLSSSELSDIEKLKAENRLLKAQTQQQQMEIDFLKKLDEIERR